MLTVSRHIILWIVALSILNSSIDVLETFIPLSFTGHHNSASQQQEYDAIESIAELVIHEVTNQGLPDTKNKEQQSLLKKPIAFVFSLPIKKEKLLSPFIINIANQPQAVSDVSMLPAGFTLVFSPPPDRA